MDARQFSKHSTYFNSFNLHNKGLLLTSALVGALLALSQSVT